MLPFLDKLFFMKKTLIFILLLAGLCACGNKHATNQQTSTDISYSLLGTYHGKQAGCAWQDYIFRFNTNNTFNVYALSTGNKIGSFQLDKDLYPHCNTACFSNERFDAADPFPLLYINAYNNKELPKGTCYVHRIICHEPDSFATALVQTISIDFTEDTLWTNGTEDTRPYGNFALDTTNHILWVYTLRDTDRTTRFFKFALPSLAAGENVMLTKADIIDQFDCNYFKHIQDNCCHNGLLYLCTGYGIEDDLAYLRVINPTKKAEVLTINLNDIALNDEPEYIDFHNNTLLYGMGKDSVFIMSPSL